MSFEVYVDKVNQYTQKRGVYETGEDNFKHCKSLKEIRDIFLTKEKDTLRDAFKIDGKKADFVLAKVNKKGLATFQCFYDWELENSTRFIKE